MKTKKIFLTSLSLTFVFLFIIASNVSAVVVVDYIDYPETVKLDETAVIDVIVHLEYLHICDRIVGPEACLFYSINSLSVAHGGLFIPVFVGRMTIPASITFSIPVSTLEVGDVIRFEFRTDWKNIWDLETGLVVSDIYRIDIEQEEQTTTDETTTTDKTGGINRTDVPLAGIIAIGISLTLVAVAVIFNIIKKKTN
ncbi:MAG: hypothetical protein KAU62_16450 [Candidatus Heimdallarchaeota archaeon]|nr:hypothetical protein [Candidatus Heimdallarchaeota archaeon]MCK4612747.1 hypothetical protein [Candidatus Heimdallarchaeota archaeon]